MCHTCLRSFGVESCLSGIHRSPPASAPTFCFMTILVVHFMYPEARKEWNAFHLKSSGTYSEMEPAAHHDGQAFSSSSVSKREYPLVPLILIFISILSIREVGMVEGSK